MVNLKLLDPEREIDVPPEEPTERPGLGGASKWALYATFAFFAAFFLFAAFAPISGGALAPGIISPEGSRKVVQHFEGGIISRIMVEDGDLVQQGDLLITLNETQTMAERNIALSQVQTLKVMEARMEAEQLSLREMMLPPVVTDSTDPQLTNFIQRQQTLLNQGLDLAEARGGLLDQRIRQLRSEIEGLNGTIDSLRGQQILLRQEIQSTETLVQKGFYKNNSPRLLNLRRDETNIDGQVASSQAQIARLRGQISEIDVQRLELEAQRQQELARQLADVRAELAAAEERLVAAEDVLSRTQVKAPSDGAIVNLRYKTVGGVVRSGEPIVDIVPLNERMIIEARVNPTDIDIITPGQDTQVTFSALRRDLPQIMGDVLSVDSGTTLDEVTGMTYYKARIEVPIDELEQLGIKDKLFEGMPADVMIKTESRTLLQYLTQPFQDTFRRAFRESDVNTETGS
ncbi:MAG: HlyD family type I secretion periplasmic adaptor subunit [Pseudomonadota bacterium]